MSKTSNVHWEGFLLMLAGLLVYYFRPLQNCAWYNIFCGIGSLFSTSIFVTIAILLVVFGAWKVIKQ